MEQKSIQSGNNELKPTKVKTKNIVPNNFQLSLFDAVDPVAGQLKEALSTLDLNTMTPIECMLKLHELRKMLDQ